MQGPTLELNDTMVRAGAGAGKTRGLVEKVVEVFRLRRESLGAGGSTPRIVLTTFTRKATQELKERLILRAVNDQDPELLQFVTDSTRLHISTIHGLLNLFLKQIGHLAGLDPGFQIISEKEGGHLARLALREILVRDAESLTWLEVYGFERTLQMCRAYQNFYREHGGLRAADLENIRSAIRARIDFWRGQVGELIAEIRETSDEATWVRYADELAAMIVRWSHALPTVEALPKKPRRSKKLAELESLFIATETVIDRLKEELSEPCWNADLWPQMIEEWARFAPFAEEFTRQLNELKESQARFEMSDLELKSLEILREKPFLAAIFSEAWDFWMIDEYQDTSPLQVEILNLLIADRPKYLVGDPQQSIYLFRGAEVGVFSEAERTIAKDGGQTVELIRNYRSAPDLLMWINDFMQSVNRSFMRMEPRAEIQEHSKPCVTLYRAADGEIELDGVVHFVHQLLAEGARLEEICVISRTHRGLMDVSAKLKQFGYPTHVHSSRGFNSRREVLDAQALWKFLANPHDNQNLLILLRSPWFFVDDWLLEEWMSNRPQSLWRKLMSLDERAPDAIARLKSCRVLVNQEGMTRAFESALCESAMIDLSLENDPAGRKESNLWKLIHKAQMLEKEGGQTILDLLQAESDNPLEANEGDATSAQEPNCINLMTIHGSKGLEFDHVIVPRMHEKPNTSKTPPLFAREGVFFFPVWDETESTFSSSPLDFSSVREMRERELAEYDRWLYVALTRAKKSLTLTWSGEGKDSWVSRTPWFAKSNGQHSTANYTYVVVEEIPSPARYESSSRETVSVRSEFHPSGTATPDDHVSVSELVEKGMKSVHVDLVKRWEAQSLGMSVHRALEGLKYGASSAASLEGNDSVASAQGAADSAEGEAVRYVLGLQEPPLAEMIQQGHTEWGFQVRTPLRVVEGQIDLWAKSNGRLFVVDYKSGSPKGKEAAFKQLSLYAWALRKFGHQDPISMVVVYPLQKKTESQEFSEQLFRHWENEFGVAQT